MSAASMKPMHVQKGNAGWNDIHIVEDQVGISGGYLCKPLTAQSILVMNEGIHMRFVEVVKNTEWFF